MPSHSGSTSTTSVQAPLAVNPSLTNLFTSLFTNGLGKTASDTLTGIMNGTTLGQNISSIYKTLSTQGRQQYQQGIASINASAGATGNRFGTTTAGQVGTFANQYQANLNAQASQYGLSEEQLQGSAASGILGVLSSAANQYYSPGSSTSGAQSLPWTQGVQAIASLFA